MFVLGKSSNAWLHGAISQVSLRRWTTLAINMLNCFKDYQKMHLHFVSYLWLCSTEEDEIHNGATLRVAHPILSIPCLLMPLRRKEQGHQQALYWQNKPEYSVFRIRRANHNPEKEDFPLFIHFDFGQARNEDTIVLCLVVGLDKICISISISFKYTGDINSARTFTHHGQ